MWSNTDEQDSKAMEQVDAERAKKLEMARPDSQVRDKGLKPRKAHRSRLKGIRVKWI